MLILRETGDKNLTSDFWTLRATEARILKQGRSNMSAQEFVRQKNPTSRALSFSLPHVSYPHFSCIVSPTPQTQRSLHCISPLLAAGYEGRATGVGRLAKCNGGGGALLGRPMCGAEPPFSFFSFVVFLFCFFKSNSGFPKNVYDFEKWS